MYDNKDTIEKQLIKPLRGELNENPSYFEMGNINY